MQPTCITLKMSSPLDPSTGPQILTETMQALEWTSFVSIVDGTPKLLRPGCSLLKKHRAENGGLTHQCFRRKCHVSHYVELT